MASIIAVAHSLVTPGPLNRSPHRIDAGCCDKSLFLSWRTDDLCRLLATLSLPPPAPAFEDRGDPTGIAPSPEPFEAKPHQEKI